VLVYILTIIGFVLVIKGGGLLVDGASSIARRTQISEFVIGLTVVAFGTSCPELFVNVMASIHGSNQIAISNIIGSNIANIFLILGISASIYPLTVSKGTVWKEIPLALLAIVLLGILVSDNLIDNREDSVLSRIDGLVLTAFFIIFICYSISIAGTIEDLPEYVSKKQYNIIKACIFVIIGLAFLVLGGNWIVKGAVTLARVFNVSESLIALTIVAVGTSLPELATSVIAAYKKNVEIAVGNVIGSNIFNVFFILAISSLIRPINFAVKSYIDVGVAILGSLILFGFMFTGIKRTLDRWEGVMLCSLYAGYIIFLIIRG